MGTWDCVDGALNERWEYVSLEIMSDIGRVLRALDAGWPAPGIDTTAWSLAISREATAHPASQEMIQTEPVELVALAEPALGGTP